MEKGRTNKNDSFALTLANFVGSQLSPSSNGRHMATRRSVKLLVFGSHFICLQPLYGMHFHSSAPPPLVLTRPPFQLYLTPCAWLFYIQAVASVVGWCCRRRAWLLKYIIYEILHRKVRKERKVKVTMSLRTLRSLR